MSGGAAAGYSMLTRGPAAATTALTGALVTRQAQAYGRALSHPKDQIFDVLGRVG